MGFFGEHARGTYYTSAKNILAAKAYFADNPQGCIDTGMWANPTWDKMEFDRYLTNSLHAKINRTDNRTGRKLTKEYQDKLLGDGRKIRDYIQGRIRNTGCSGHLSTPEMKKRFQHINQQREE